TADIRRAVWQKLMTNVSLSALTGVMGMPMGFVSSSASCWALCEMLIREVVAVAAADGVVFDAEEKIAEVRAVAEGGPTGITSICADLLHGRKTEVDTISGSVVRAARRLHVSAPRHEMMALLIHAIEDKNEQSKR
ncbi:MAG: ketopantoate reductase C-terminal domain-containing protein, partial [Clostridia bacterium]|nr:ketopantoate reductase C-terminal domain-containing protein [Clostridia bacterium]